MGRGQKDDGLMRTMGYGNNGKVLRQLVGLLGDNDSIA